MKKAMILSGAGLSAPSGLKTFRDSGGLWEEYDVMEVCSASGFKKNPKKVLDFYDARRKQLKEVTPNSAHKLIATLKSRYKQNLFIVTQNVDDLLERAGCAEVIHLHGFLPELRCLHCGEIFNIGYESIQGKSCPQCESTHLRHNIVMFEEAAPAYQTLYTLLDQTGFFIALGTSGQVLPVGHYARMCEKSVLNTLENDQFLQSFFDTSYIESVESALPKIAKQIEEFFNA